MAAYSPTNSGGYSKLFRRLIREKSCVRSVRPSAAMHSHCPDSSPFRKRSLRYVLVLVSLIPCAPGHAQTAGTGALTGNIVDPSGAGVGGAQVKAMSETTGETRAALSRATGSYLIPLLLPGLYAVEIVQSGFK